MLKPAKFLAIISMVSTGAMFGFFYAYYCSVIWGLDASDPREAITVMKNINQAVRNFTFLSAFLLTPLFIILAAALTYRAGRSPHWFVIGALVYIAGGAILTNMTNVPLNEWLKSIAIEENLDVAKEVWTQYSTEWKYWNFIRMIASGVTLVCVGLGVMQTGSEKAMGFG